MVKNKFFKKAISGITALSLLLPNFANLAVSAEEPEKFQYTMFGRNGITMSVSSNLCMNGNLHTNKDATITAINKNINGKVTTSADIEKRVKHVYADQKIYDTYFITNCEVHEEEYVYSDMNIHINNPLFCYSNITLDGNVSLNSSLGTLMNINVTGEVKNANNSVVYSKYGNITIENDSTANVNGLIYAPLGTVTINSPNVTINGIIIADQVVINGSSVNINCNDNIARFIGETSEEYIFSGLEYLPEEWLGDTDEDALFDIYEKVIDSDPFNPDTDTDGLPDGYEVLTLGTDPLEIDTDENGILDCDEDFDTDNLNNLGEYQYQTLPFTSDTDEDGLLDGDEVNYYGTIPTDADTDDDKLLDGEEGYNGCIYIEHGVYFDPLNPDTDGNGILDGDEVFGQTKVEEVETYDEAITEVTVDMDTNGNIDRNLTIESMYNIDAMSTNVHALIGEPFNFETESDFESATITFKIDQSKLGDTQFDNLMILWYNEEEQIFEEMPTTHDIVNSTVSTTTTHFSQYMVVDSEKWYDNWEISFDQLRKMWTGNTSYYKPMNTILLLDCSHQMGNIDPINYRQIVSGYNGVNEDNFYDITNDMDNPGDAEYNYKKYGKRKCYRAEISENIINQMSNDDRAVVMTFSNDVETRTGWSSNWDMLMNGGVSRTSGIQKVNNDGSASFLDNAIQSALSYVEDNAKEAYRIIVITHSDVRCTYNLSSYDYSNVNLNIVNLGSGNISAFLESIVESTGGEVYDAITADELTTQVGGVVTVPPQFVGVDSDGDGIPDLVELYGLKPNGDPINTNPNLKDTDGDGIEDNDELGYIIGAIGSNATIADYVKALQPHSDPAKFDSDDDGLDDELEQLIGTNIMLPDTDKDGLSDGEEVSLWFDPLNSNSDDDSFDDFEENENGTDPFTYNQTQSEWNKDLAKGFFLGDFIDCNNVPKFLGQLTSGFIPIIADLRDVIANAANGEWGFALLSGVGLVPAAGDAAKIAGSLGEFIAKHADDAPMIIQAINKVADDVPDIIKHLPSSAIDNIVKALKNGQAISKAEYQKLKKLFAAAGKNLDELIELPLKYADEITSKITRIADNYKNLECVECADELMEYLKSIGQNGKRLNLTYGNSYIIHNLYSTTEAISHNGKHSAILFNNKVYDNLFPSGVDYNKWINGFEALGEKTIETIDF